MFATLGRFCYRNRRAVALTWLVAVVAGFLVGYRVFDRFSVDYAQTPIESFQGIGHLRDASPVGPRLLALVQAPNVADPQVRSAVQAGVADLAALPEVARVLDPYAAEGTGVSPDGQALLVSVFLSRDVESFDAAREQVEQRLHAVRSEQVRVAVSSSISVQDELNEQTRRDTERGELIALPATFLVMLVVFGGVLAAGIPLLGAVASVAGGLSALYAFSYVLDLDPSVASVTTVLGLGLSIDYSLLMVSRYREERGRGLAAEEAVVATTATAGRTITFSALVVAVSLSALFVFKVQIFPALGAAGVSVVLVALLAGLTLTPAVLGLLGHRVGTPSEPLPDDGAFARVARAVQRRPWPVALGVAALLLAAGSPFLHVQFQNGGADLLPRDSQSRQFADAAAARFPQTADPVQVLARVPAERLQQWGDAVVPGVDGVLRAAGATDLLDGWSMLEVTPAGASQGEVAQQVVLALRAERPPYPTWVTGDAAVLVDFEQDVVDGLPAAALVIGLGTLVLLFLMTGSVLVPVKALVMNVLSLGAAFGMLVTVFQDGHLSGLLGFDSPGALETWVPVVVFCFAFGLSMDYEVFLLSRIKEIHATGVGNDRAVELGLQRSGRIITSAALLFFIVVSGFAAGQMLGIKELGTALAVAVAVDATLVRCLLVPATMTLLGEWNWWAPAPLRRLHARVGLREHPASSLPGLAAQGSSPR